MLVPIFFLICGYGGIGRRARFRFWCLRRAGSSPVARIKTPDSRRFLLIIFGNNKKCIMEYALCKDQKKEMTGDEHSIW